MWNLGKLRKRKMKQTTIPILDNGHGDNTPGKRSPQFGGNLPVLYEWEFNRDIVSRICRMCDREGIEYRVLVPESNDISLKLRCSRANEIYSETGGKCFLLSIHANAGGGTGWECFTTKGETKSDRIAEILADEWWLEFGDQWRIRADYSDGDVDKESQFYILQHTKCPAVLSENLFFDNYDNYQFLMTDAGRERIANVHFETIKRLIYD